MDRKASKMLCQSFMHRYVEVKMADGCCHHGIVEQADDEWLCLAVPGAVDGMHGYAPAPSFRYPSEFAHPYLPRRFEHLVLPMAGLVQLSPLPYY